MRKALIKEFEDLHDYITRVDDRVMDKTKDLSIRLSVVEEVMRSLITVLGYKTIPVAQPATLKVVPRDKPE